jgi:nicotinamide riboside kinase
LRYDLAFLCADDIPYDDSWDRSGEGNREWMQEQIRGDLVARGDEFTELRGSLKERVSRVKAVLAERWWFPPDRPFHPAGGRLS